jgi:hypothetical protein
MQSDRVTHKDDPTVVAVPMPPPAAGEVSGVGQGMDEMPVGIEECTVIVLRMTLI